MPTIPQKAAGWRIEPPVSDPSAAAQSPADTAAAEPPEDPPGTQSAFQGLRVVLVELFSVDEPMANSSRLVLPITIAPAEINFATAVAV